MKGEVEDPKAAPDAAPAVQHHVKILYCSSSGMREYFLEAKKFIETSYPELYERVEGGVYPPPASSRLLAIVAGYLWSLVLVLVVGGKFMFSMLDVQTPEAVVWIGNNKAVSLVALYLMNKLSNLMLTTGAFEVYLDDVKLYSKLDAGALPSPRDLIEIFKAKGLYAA